MTDDRVSPYLGRLLDEAGAAAGTCFQVAPGVLVTAWHVLDALGAAGEGAAVSVDPLRGGSARLSQVVKLDPLHDLAVLRCDDLLPGSVAGLGASDEVALSARVVITGVAALDDPGRAYRHLDAAGRWAGGTMLDDQVPIGRVEARAVQPGMSGAPVVRDHADARERLVIGVVSARYNSTDGWGRDSVWVARTEDLAPLLAGVAEVTVTRQAWAGPAELVLSVTDAETRLTGAGAEVSGPHGGVTGELADAMHGLREGRVRLTGLRSQDLTEAPPSRLSATPVAVGQLMAQSFLPGPVAAALGEVVSRAQAAWTPVRLGIDVRGSLRELPWEALAVPGTASPLALHPLLIAYRRESTPTSDAAAPAALGGPLRIVVAISSPLSGGGQLLDYERELRNVLAAVRGARQGQARVQIVHFATTAEIRAALAAEPAHVLHLSGHGRPGAIELEDDEGNARVLGPDEFVAEAIPPGRMPAVVALAACYTGAAASQESQSFAAALIARGARAVIGTETAVTDVYATRVFARVYAELTDTDTADIVAAVAQARRVVQQQLSGSPDRRDQHLAALGEWAVLTVLTAAGTVGVLDPAAPPTIPARGSTSAGTGLAGGLLARDTGEFVGRRRAQRRWPVELLAPRGTGLVLHGIGGAGKNTLAAELIRRVIEREPQRLPVIASSGLSGGQVTADQVLAAIARALRHHSQGTRRDLDQAAQIAERGDVDWQQRLQVLQDHALGEVPALVVLDNFEDNLNDASPPDQPGWRTVANQDLASLLAALVTRPGRSRLLITTRYPFVLPGHADRAMSFRPVGPLTAAETMKLAWALPALDQLTEPELQRVWNMVGGHPRCLEYLDALLSGGRGAYPDITTRLADQLARRPDLPAPGTWQTTPGTLEPAMAQTLTIAADDILLDQLLTGLRNHPGAEDLLLGLSIYRSPIDYAGLLFQAGSPDDTAAAYPNYKQARQQITAILTTHHIDLDQLANPASLPPDVLNQIKPYLAELQRLPAPPRRAPEGLQRLVDICAASSLLSAVPGPAGPELLVHRWTASELHARWHHTGRGDQLTTAHERAADYWNWRVRVWPQDRASDLDDLTEARHHLFAAGHAEAADQVTWQISEVLHAQGAWDREDALIRDTLTQIPADADGRSNWTRQLGDIAYGRGRTAEAASLYELALGIDKQLTGADPANAEYQRQLSVSYSKLADLARDAGDTTQATRLHQQALDIREQLTRTYPANAGYQHHLHISYGRLADLATDVGNTAEATRLYQQTLAIREQLTRTNPANTQNQRDLSVSCNRLADLARDAGDPTQATRLYQQTLAIREQLTRTNPANTQNQRGLSFEYGRVAELAAEMGDSKAAALAWTRALEFCTDVLGADHPLTRATEDQLRESPDENKSS